MRRAAGRMRIRIENLIQELHRQAAWFLVDSFDVILSPTCIGPARKATSRFTGHSPLMDVHGTLRGRE